MATEHILLTGLGNRATQTLYQLGSATATAALTPLALIQLLDHDARPDRVIALCTEGAKSSTWQMFQDSVCKTLGIEAECVDIPDGRTGDEIREIVEKAAAQFAEGDDLTLDVTQGLRHFPFVGASERNASSFSTEPISASACGVGGARGIALLDTGQFANDRGVSGLRVVAKRGVAGRQPQRCDWVGFQRGSPSTMWAASAVIAATRLLKR